jgi:hypothetical protein
LTLTFRCPAELEGLLPPPIPAAQGLPDWFKMMPPQAFNPLHARMGDTVKRCPPFIDAMTFGFLIPLICDVKVDNGEFSWDNDLPPGGEIGFVRSPIGVHDASQVMGTPLFESDRFLDQIPEPLDHRGSGGLRAAVHPSGQPVRPAIHHFDRPGRLRPLP